MKPTRKLNRRSFLGTVAGGVAGAGALAAVSGEALAFQSGCSDNDGGQNADPVGNGRSCRSSGCSDNDRGQNADPIGNGRSCRTPVNCSDNDRGTNADPVGRGRSCAPSCSDNDRGTNADPVGRGRSCGGGRTGITDNDPGDRPDYGRGTRNCSDSDRGNGADPGGRGRRC